MAKLRQNHNRRNHSLFGGSLKFIFLLLILIFSGVYWYSNSETDASFGMEDDFFQDDGKGARSPGTLKVQDSFLPTSTTNEIIKHEHYAISYSEKHEQAEWVAYELTKESIQAPNVKRTGDFRPDRQVANRSAHPKDYKNSGYDRGHLAPAGDMAFSQEAMSETFLMSNMSPQVRAFNGGAWRELEENVRDWAYKFKHLYVVTGPVLTRKKLGTIGQNSVTIPSYYFKVLLDLVGPEIKAIAFLMPNEVTDKHLSKFAVTIDEVEEITGIDFFSNLLDEASEEKLERNSNPDLWPFDEKKFRSRIKNWNNR